MILNSNNTYTGTTTINGGTLEVDGSTAGSSAVTVNVAAFWMARAQSMVASRFSQAGRSWPAHWPAWAR